MQIKIFTKKSYVATKLKIHCYALRCFVFMYKAYHIYYSVNIYQKYIKSFDLKYLKVHLCSCTLHIHVPSTKVLSLTNPKNSFFMIFIPDSIQICSKTIVQTRYQFLTLPSFIRITSYPIQIILMASLIIC